MGLQKPSAKQEQGVGGIVNKRKLESSQEGRQGVWQPETNVPNLNHSDSIEKHFKHHWVDVILQIETWVKYHRPNRKMKSILEEGGGSGEK